MIPEAYITHANDHYLNEDRTFCHFIRWYTSIWFPRWPTCSITGNMHVLQWMHQKCEISNWLITKILLPQKKIAKENPHVYDENIGGYMPIILNYEEMVCKYPVRKFCEPNCNMIWETLFNCWNCSWSNFGWSMNLSKKTAETC